MQVQPSVGLQWKIGLFQLATSFVACIATGLSFLLARQAGAPEAAALTTGLGLGVLVALAGSGAGFWWARTIKFRLWEAGDLATRIAQGDLKHRLVPGPPDELGWLEHQLNAMAGHLERAVAELRDLADQNRRLAEQAGRGAALEERARLARELHDTVNQQLFALSLGIATIRRELSQTPGFPQRHLAELDRLENAAREAHGQIRELILQLRPVSLERHGLGPALKEYAERIAREERWQLEVELPAEPDSEEGLDPAAREHLFRLGQEALANVRRHARASRVLLRLDVDEDSVTLTVRDDGVGFEPKRPPRPTAVGIVGMRERVRSVGGRLEIMSAPGAGTTVKATVPRASRAREGARATSSEEIGAAAAGGTGAGTETSQGASVAADLDSD